MSEKAVRQFFYKEYCVANCVDENWIMIRNSKKDLVAIKGHGHLALEQVLPTSYPLQVVHQPWLVLLSPDILQDSHKTTNTGMRALGSNIFFTPSSKPNIRDEHKPTMWGTLPLLRIPKPTQKVTLKFPFFPLYNVTSTIFHLHVYIPRFSLVWWELKLTSMEGIKKF